MGLFDRISRVVRAEITAHQSNDYMHSDFKHSDFKHSDFKHSNFKENYLSEGTALVARGAIAGASLGKVGLLAGGAGYSLGAVPLAALGALTGAALYETLRSLLEGDSSAAGVAAIGAATGAATSATIGGVGVAVGGTAFGVGMASMAAGGAVVGLGLVGLSRLLQQGIDPEKLLDSAIEQMEADLQKARQAIVTIRASQIQLKQQYEQKQAEVDKWERRAWLALQNGNDSLAREALLRKQTHLEILNSLKEQLDRDPPSVQAFKQDLALLEAKIAEAKIVRTSLKAQLATVVTNTQLHGTIATLGNSSAMEVFERMEEKVMQMEARFQATAESVDSTLTNSTTEQSFLPWESGSDADVELEALKAELLQGSTPSTTQPMKLTPPADARWWCRC